MTDWLASRRTISMLLAAGAVLYAAGALMEASSHAAPVATPAGQASPAATGGETGDETTEHHATPGTDGGSSEAVAGFDLESPTFVIAAVLLFAALALGLWVSRAVVLVAAAGLVAAGGAVLDVREFQHQLAVGRTLIVLVAVLLLVVHAATAAGAAMTIRTRRPAAL